MLCILPVFFFLPKDYTFENNKFHYNRGSVNFKMELMNQSDNLVFKVQVETRDFLDYKTTLYGLLILPNKTKSPGVVLLPGGGVSKEGGIKAGKENCILWLCCLYI